MNRHQFTRWRNHQKVVMAIYWLAEPDGVRCYATWRELADETGLGEDTVRLYVRRLEEAGIVRVPRVRDRPNRRTIVLMDHPEAADYLDHLSRSRNREPWRSKLNEDVGLDWVPQTQSELGCT